MRVQVEVQVDPRPALASPSTAQAVAQVRALTQQVSGLIDWVGREALA